MTLSASLYTASTGLAMNARLSDTTASNVANALTEGYAQRQLILSAQSFGGVTIEGVQRNLNQALLSDLRLAAAQSAAHKTAADFFAAFATAIGDADEATSLTGRIANLDRALIEAAARPDALSRLTAVVDAAKDISDNLNALSNQLQNDRESADRSIESEVDSLNANLRKIADLNKEIGKFRATGRDYSGLLDQRQSLVSQISELLPIREVQKDNAQIALYTINGAQLLDGRPSEIYFKSAVSIVPDMTAATGDLSGLTINGQPISTSPDGGRLGEGRITALFRLRDKDIPTAQAQIDALARDLIERFSASNLDPTLSTGQPGLFTDAGLALDPSTEKGLASRIAINPALIHDDGSGVFRIRDGIGATSPGPSGNPNLIIALSQALNQQRILGSDALTTAKGSAADFAATMISTTAYQRLAVEKLETFAAARSESLKSELLRDGVDTDQEMQTLLVLEKAYAANAKVIQTVDTLLATLLGI